MECDNSTLYSRAQDLFPICRSLTGNGVRETLGYLKTFLPNLKVLEVPTGSKVYDWEVPKEWNIKNAYVKHIESNKKVIDFQDSNLHVVGYSTPVNKVMDLDELKDYIHTLPDQPDAIPYITSYYKERWGFCMTHNEFLSLSKGKYEVVIESSLEDGYLTYGELIIPGKSKKEILLSTYVCHPSMGNNEISGPVVTSAIAEKIQRLETREFTYRIIFIPETIGSITYISKNFEQLKENIIAGFVITCIGDDNNYSFLPSRNGSTLADRAARCALKELRLDYKEYSFLTRGSDERQFCSPGVDLPVASIMRSKYGTYPEYHTSLDDLKFISQEGLQGGLNAIWKALTIIEQNNIFENKILCEPQLGKRGLYPTTSTKDSGQTVREMMNILAYSDGNHDVIDLSFKLNIPFDTCLEISKKLEKNKILKRRFS